MIPKLIWKPFTQGGTWVMDYHLLMEDLIVQAIFNLKREDIVLCSVPVEIVEGGSIHVLSDNFDITDVWTECFNLEKDKN